MKLLLAARSAGAFSEWSDHLEPLSAQGWEIVFATQNFEDGPGTAELRARLWHDPAWSLISLPNWELNYPQLSNRALLHWGSLGRLTFEMLNADKMAMTLLEELAPDRVAVIDYGKTLPTLGPLITAAIASGIPRILLRGWGPPIAREEAALFTDLVVPDPDAIPEMGQTRVHGIGPMIKSPAMTKKLAEQLLAAIGLDPQKPFILHLRGRNNNSGDRQPDPIEPVLKVAIAADLQVAILPDPKSGKTVTQEPSTDHTPGLWKMVSLGSRKNSQASTKRFFRALMGHAHIITGEGSRLLLDAAAAGMPVAALPQAMPTLRRAAQIDRFGEMLLSNPSDLSVLIERPQNGQKFTPKEGSLEKIFHGAATSTVGSFQLLIGKTGTQLSAAEPVLTPAPFIVRPAVERTITQRDDINLSKEAVLSVLETIAASDRPVLVGPWISEVGFEVLYWIPFVRWCLRRFGIDPKRLWVCSRGGVYGWYADLNPAQYLDIFEMVDEGAFRQKTLQRFVDSGGQKHISLGELDDLVDTEVQYRSRSEKIDWLHPQLMYRFFRQYWFGREGRNFFDEHTLFENFRPEPQPRLNGALPANFIAARFYFRSSFPDTIETRNFATRLIAKFAKKSPIVLLDTGLQLDDHVEFTPTQADNIFRVGHLITGRNNLAIQSDIIRQARLFVGTYGGLSYIPPFYGVPSIAVSTNMSAFLSSHLETAVHIFHKMGQSFTHLDTAQTEELVFD